MVILDVTFLELMSIENGQKTQILFFILSQKRQNDFIMSFLMKIIKLTILLISMDIVKSSALLFTPAKIMILYNLAYLHGLCPKYSRNFH